MLHIYDKYRTISTALIAMVSGLKSLMSAVKDITYDTA
jgi:hypothetical protein